MSIGSLGDLLLNPTAVKFFEKAIYLICTAIFDKDQAQKLSDAYVAMFLKEFKFKTFEPDYFCQVELSACNSKQNKYKILNKKVYQDRILADKPDFIKDNNFINNLYKEINEDIEAGNERETILMYHISDLHWNLDYKEGTNNNCGEIACCKEGLKPPTKESEKAGKWGDYN